MLLVFPLLVVASPEAWASRAANREGTPTASPDAMVPNFALRPVGGSDLEVFRIEAEPGSSTVIDVEVQNIGNMPLDLRTYVANTKTQVNGGFGLEEEGVELRSPSTWLDFSPETLTLDLEDTHYFSATITVPIDTEPGEYINGFGVRMVDALPIQGSTTFTQIIQKNAAIVITVPGDVFPAIELGAPEVAWNGSNLMLQLPVANTGNVFVAPRGEMSIWSLEGDQLMSAPVQMNNVYTGHSTSLAINLGSGLPAGEYLVSIELSDDEYPNMTASLQDVAISVSSSPAELANATIAFGTVAIEPNAAPVQYVSIGAEVINRGEDIPSARIVLNVTRDGELVEEFIMADNVPLPSGDSTFSQRYIPLQGFQTGTWGFVLRVESLDSAGVATVLQSTQEQTIQVP